jgi:thiol-disulfide isomerase/thioredoxin
MAHYILLVSFLLLVPATYLSANAAKPADPHAKPADPHAKPADPHAKPADAHGSAEEPAAPPVPQGPRRQYFPGNVLDFPSFTANFIDQDKTLDYAPKKGHSIVLIFVSSWCEPCQILMPDLKHLARKYSSNSTKIYFVYAHDTKQDAEGSAKEHQVTAYSVFANNKMLASFKNPEIPSVFISDKWGYMADQFQYVKKSNIDQIDKIMGKINVL